MHIQSIPMWVGSSNNYAYIVTDETTKDAVVIDPANPPEVGPVLKSLAESKSHNLTAIINTHHHWDHAGGNTKILSALSSPIPVLGGSDCEGVTHTPADRQEFTFPLPESVSPSSSSSSTSSAKSSITVTPLHTPCHTLDSICWYFEDTSQTPPQRAVFTGDTLFIGGCGKFFEGTAAQMHRSLNKTLASLPDDTAVYPGHEYTKSNVKFLVSVSKSEPILKLQDFAENNKETQGKFTIGDEKNHNVFMRVDTDEMRKVTGKEDPVEVMAKLRR